MKRYVTELGADLLEKAAIIEKIYQKRGDYKTVAQIGEFTQNIKTVLTYAGRDLLTGIEAARQICRYAEKLNDDAGIVLY